MYGNYCCEILKNNAKEIINFEQKNMVPITIEGLGPYKSQNFWYISGEELDYHDENVA